MQALRLALSIACAALALSAHAQDKARIETRFGAFAGSSENLQSLVFGLRTGGDVVLVGSGETATFTSPARPMGYGNITRALDLAQRQLAAAGIQDPTPSEIQAALTGGSVTGTNGTVTYEGILQMRASGMGWGQIAHAVGVHPGMGKGVAVKSAAPAPTTTGTAGGGGGLVTAAGGSPFSHSNGRALGRSGTTTTSAPAGASSAAGAQGAAGGANGKALGHLK